MYDFGFKFSYLLPKICFRNNTLSELTQHHNSLQKSHSKCVENYATTDATVFQCFTKLIE